MRNLSRSRPSRGARTFKTALLAAFQAALLCFAAASSAVADDVSQVEALIEKANEARRRGEHRNALALLEEALRVQASPRVLAQLGLVLHDLEEWIDAEASLGTALDASQDPWIRKNRRPLEAILTIARSHLGEVEITGPPGAEVVLGGKRLGSLPAGPFRLVKGEALFAVSAPGMRTVRFRLDVIAGRRQSIGVTLEPEVADVGDEQPAGQGVQASQASQAILTPPGGPAAGQIAKPRPRQPAPVRGTDVGVRVVGIAATVLGVAAAAGGGVALYLDGRCSERSLDGVSCITSYQSQTTGFILLGGGVLLTGMGGYLVYRSGELSVVATPWSVAGRF